MFGVSDKVFEEPPRRVESHNLDSRKNSVDLVDWNARHI